MTSIVPEHPGTFSKANAPAVDVVVFAEYEFVCSSTCAPKTEAPVVSYTTPSTRIFWGDAIAGVARTKKIERDGNAIAKKEDRNARGAVFVNLQLHSFVF
jgi:hypothetical protein